MITVGENKLQFYP